MKRQGRTSICAGDNLGGNGDGEVDLGKECHEGDEEGSFEKCHLEDEKIMLGIGFRLLLVE